MKLSLGPLLYYWPRAETLAFYEAAADWPVDVVHLGETVCARRHQLRLDDWFGLADTLAAAGKEVVLSTLPLIESESDLKTLRKICGNGHFKVEANDFGAVRVCIENGVPFVAGPTLNVYNPETLAMLHEAGAVRWVPPVEMSRAQISAMAVPDGMETELFAYGRLPLAYSARCFCARHYNLQKDTCEFRCLDHPDGLTLNTREGDAFLAINGIQTQSAGVYSLDHRVEELGRAGIDVVRLSPQYRHMDRIVDHWRQSLTATPRAEAHLALRSLMPGAPCDGYWLGRSGQDYCPAVSA